MKRLYKLILGLSFATYTFASFAIPQSPSIEIIVNEAPDIKQRPNKGQRIPSLPKECTIDFENHRIKLSTAEVITTFELWDIDGTNLIGSYVSDSEFVNFMSGLSGEHQIRLIGMEHVYIGYLEL